MRSGRPDHRSPLRHPGEGRGLPPTDAPRRARSRVKPGMTMAALLALAGCAGVAVTQQTGSTAAPASAPAGPPPQPAQAGPPPQPAQAGPPPQPAPAGPPAMPQPVTLAQRPGASGGEALFVEHCASCHGPNGMGTGLLGRTRPVALLEARGDLAAQFVILAARNGIGNMPAIPRGEVSDAELEAIAAYLASGPRGGGQ